MPYIGTSPTQGVRVRYIYTATSSQTAFSGADANGVTLRYQDEEYVDVYKNGLILKTGTDYSLSNNTTMTLASGASNGDKIAIIVYDVFNVTVDDAYTKSTADSRFLNVAGDTMSGALDLNGVELVLDADADTSITADTDDQIDIKIAGADDFQFTANTFTAQSGSSIVVPDGGLTFGSTAITSTGAELNILDGVTSTTAELNILDGVTSTPAELNILDGVTSTATELNIVDGNTSATSTTLADADRVVVNDNGTMVQVALTDFETYFESALDTLSNVTTVGALNSGSITSGFGNIDNGSSTITTTGAISGGSLTANGGVTVDNITIDGTEIDLSSGDLTVDVAGDIILDADGANIIFKDGGTSFGEVKTNSTPDHFIFTSLIQDKDYYFQGNDGGSIITALQLDMSDAGAAIFNNNVTAFSDERLKSNIETIQGGLEKVEQLRGVTYTRDERDNIGVIAQEVEKVLPEIVLTADDEMGTKSVDYSRITAVLIEAVKELSAKVKYLEENS